MDLRVVTLCWPRTYTLGWLGCLLCMLIHSMPHSRPATPEHWAACCVTLLVMCILGLHGPEILPMPLEGLPCVRRGLRAMHRTHAVEEEGD